MEFDVDQQSIQINENGSCEENEGSRMHNNNTENVSPVPDAMDTIVDDQEDNSINQSTTLVCTATDCKKEIDEFMIQCNKCKFAIHFTCTRLPAYQLSMFMTKGYKRYICESCYGEVDEYYRSNCCDNEMKNERENELLMEIE